MLHHRRVPKGFMLRGIEIHVQNAPVSGWDPETNELIGGGTSVIWTGNAPQMLHYVRVQIPFGPNNPVPHIPVDSIIKIMPPDPDSTWPQDDDLGSYTLRVRNTINSSNPWLRNLLCGADVSEASP